MTSERRLPSGVLSRTSSKGMWTCARGSARSPRQSRIMGSCPMNEKFLVLERNIQKDLASIEKQYEDLGAPDLSGTVPPKELIFVAYHLHGLYTAFENIFRNIAAAFEN